MTPAPEACGHQHEDGAYVLGALSPEGRVAFERHLPECASCARSVRELAGLPGLLARVPGEILDAGRPSAPVPDSLLPALLHRTRRAARRRTWLTAGLAAAAAAVAVAVVGVATLGWAGTETSPDPLPSAGPTTAAARQMHQVDPELSGSVSLTSVGWGTRLDLTCRYSETETKPRNYRDQASPTYVLVVTRTDGTSEQVASWRGLPDTTLHLAAATAADTEDVASIEVRASDGATVLKLDS